MGLQAKKSNAIVHNTIRNLQEYCAPTAKLETTYAKKMLNTGKEIISKVEFKSTDKKINGTIFCKQADSKIARVKVFINYNSTSEEDKEDYTDLVKIVKKIRG